MNIEMESAVYLVEETRKTQAKFWKDIEVGDLIQFKSVLKHQFGSKGLHAADVTVVNATQGTTVVNSMNQAMNNMSGFELQEVDE